ncbi:MAG TPA: flagellar export protein FliJ [Stenomitos sp.]
MAKGFKFRLQTVLDLATRIQDQKAQALASAQARRQSVAEVLENVIAQQQAKRDELLEAQQSGILDLQAIQWSLQFLGTLADRVVTQRAALVKADEEVEAARAELMEAAQEVQVLEKLKQKARADYNLKLDREEAKFIDELATVRFVRQGGLNFGE